MIRRRYRIEATKQTLIRFLQELLKISPSGSFVQKITTDVNEEYYHVVVIAENSTHDQMKRKPFGMDSIALK